MSSYESDFALQKFGTTTVNSELLDNSSEFWKYKRGRWVERRDTLEVQKNEREKVHRQRLVRRDALTNEKNVLIVNGVLGNSREVQQIEREIDVLNDALNPDAVLMTIENELSVCRQQIAACDRNLRRLEFQAKPGEKIKTKVSK